MGRGYFQKKQLSGNVPALERKDTDEVGTMKQRIGRRKAKPRRRRWAKLQKESFVHSGRRSSTPAWPAVLSFWLPASEYCKQKTRMTVSDVNCRLIKLCEHSVSLRRHCWYCSRSPNVLATLTQACTRYVSYPVELIQKLDAFKPFNRNQQRPIMAAAICIFTPKRAGD